ncbi:transporter [Acinetobacter wanghuae]|uniref:Transporter n=1 Tax=Acinetobacter wanghuae TaxID=2662362 RepID=A0A5Q0P081_9GAMM|nr:outer membrane protein transport protein [Acinetobacter wanghuae]MQW92285.1 transporter [Acinetobacter wanghuae]QGA10525.1 transporter [Acinetobacter wanghuae]
MKLKTLSTAILLSSLPISGAFAAALDRSGQSIQAFLQPGNYFEAGISVLDANVSGKINDDFLIPSSTNNTITKPLKGSELGDMAESYYFPSAALKVQLNDNFSFGLIYDQPFGANAKYNQADTRHGAPGSTLQGNLGTNQVGAFTLGEESTEVDVQTQNLSFILGYQPTENWNIYAGPVYQTVKGNVQLRGTAYGPLAGIVCIAACNLQAYEKGSKTLYKGYEASISENSSVGWLAGLAYQIPEIALKASLTYRSEIDHKVNIEESMPWNSTLGGSLGGIPSMAEKFVFEEGKTKITTPQSVNLDFQTGIMANTVAFAQLRWVEWSNFAIRPYKFGQLAADLTNKKTTENPNPSKRGFDLIAYEKDQISANVGIGRKFNDKWAGTVMAGWDSGAGNPVSTLGPTEGYWSAGIGGQYSPTPQSFIQAGVKYFWLGDADSQVASYFGTEKTAAKFEDNDAIGYSLKIGYRF